MKIKTGGLGAIRFIFITSGQARQQALLITNVDVWHTTSLDGRGQSIVDPYEMDFPHLAELLPRVDERKQMAR